jgi:hypothetical protein
VARVTRQAVAQLGQEGIGGAKESLERSYNGMATKPVDPVASSGLGSVDVTQPLIGGTTAPIGAQGSPSSGGTLREMATNNPAIAEALGIRGATAGLLGR